MQWFWNKLHRRGEDADLKDEIEAHLRIEAAEQEQIGKSFEEAGRAARIAFGNVASVQEDVREGWRWAPLERFLQDCGFGLRLLLRSPLWTAVVCATLALGIGMSTAIFSVVYGILLKPLPYSEPNRIVGVFPVTPDAERQRFNPNPALWAHWSKTLTSVADLALTRQVANFNLTGGGSPERIQGARSTYNLPRVLGMRPMLGRAFTEEEQLADARVVLLSHALWVRRFASDESIVGRNIQLNGQPFEVIGVMPREFRYPNALFELWAPLFLPPGDVAHGANYGYLCVGRLKNGMSIETARAEMQAVMAELARAFPVAYRSDAGWIAGAVEPLAKSQAEAIRPTLLMLSAAVTCLLAIGCMNLGVLLIAKASGRVRELVVRVALGAGGSRLRQQLLAETVPLALAGALGGILLAHLLLAVLVPMLPAGTPGAERIGVHGAAIAFACFCSLAVVFLASLLPANLARVQQLSTLLQQCSTRIAGGGRIRETLVVSQVAVATLLLFGGLLFGRSFAALMAVQPGFAQEGILTMHFAVARTKQQTDPQVARYYERLIERIKSIPGVLQAGVVNRLPLSGTTQTGGIEFEGKPPVTFGGSMFMTDWRSATPGYFGAMKIPIIQGRSFLDSDREASPRVGMIDEQLARRVFGEESPIGKRFRQSIAPGQPSDEPWSEVVGVVGHVLNDSLEKDARPQVYWPETQRTQDRAVLVVRVTGDPSGYAEQVINQIHQENPDQPVWDVRSMEEWVKRSMQTRTVTTSIVSVFGFASVALACLGLYGVISFAAGVRLREFGVRLALGATASGIRKLVLGQAGRLVTLGIGIGLALCWPVAKALRGFLYGVEDLDVVSWISAPGLLLCVGLLAGLGPAMRAAKTDPAQTLRAD